MCLFVSFNLFFVFLSLDLVVCGFGCIIEELHLCDPEKGSVLYSLKKVFVSL